MNRPKVLAIVGQTASGKTSLSIELAKKYNGEVISCDSRQVYRGLDIGSGKVTADEMDDIPHHLLDISDVTDVYSANDFKRDAESAIANITEKKKLPIIAGGTFFYLDQLRGVSAPEVPPNEALRAELEALDTEVLFKRLREVDSERAEAIDQHNRRRLIRALEIVAALGSVPKLKQTDSPYDMLIIGIAIPQSELDKRIHTRLLQRLEDGMIAEVKELLEHAPATRLKSLGLEYRYVTEYLEGNVSKDELIITLQTKIRQFSRRQLTWLKRDRAIQWFKPSDRDQIHECVSAWLNA